MNAPEGLAIRAAANVNSDPRRVNADLHCHSQMSDGVLTPAEVVRRAHAHGVQIHALTDHDELVGLAEAAAEAERLGMPFVPGVEISVTWGGETIHNFSFAMLVGFCSGAYTSVFLAGPLWLMLRGKIKA